MWNIAKFILNFVDKSVSLASNVDFNYFIYELDEYNTPLYGYTYKFACNFPLGLSLHPESRTSWKPKVLKKKVSWVAKLRISADEV